MTETKQDPKPLLSRLRGLTWTLVFTAMVADVASGSSESRLVRVDETHADFSRGRLAASGRNLYVTAAGPIKQVFRYDLNQDGRADLVFNSAHDFVLAPPAVVCDLAPEGRGATRDLPGVGVKIAKAADLDSDGHTDLVVIEESQWVSSRSYLHIYWGGEAGSWTQERRTDLLVHEPLDLEVTDWDGDGFADVVVLMEGDGDVAGTPAHRVLRVYWGGSAGFLQGNHADFEAAAIREIERRTAAGSLLALTGEGTALQRLSARGRKEVLRVELPTGGATLGNLRVYLHDGKETILASSDPDRSIEIDPTTAKGARLWSRVVRLTLTDDGSVSATPSPVLKHTSYSWNSRHPDILLSANVGAASEAVRLLTGFDCATMLFQTERSIPDAAYASGAILAGEGEQTVIAVAIARNEESYDISSWVLPLGEARRGVFASKREVPTHGASGVVAVAPSGGDRWRGGRLVFTNRVSGSYVEAIPTMIYWGAKEGFSPERRLDLPFHSGIVGAGADVNDDAMTDLVLISQVHNVFSVKPYMGFHVYAGSSPQGFSKASVLKEYGVRGLAIADLDRDGWLDLIGTVLNGPMNARGWVIWPGSPTGYTPEKRTFVPFDLAHGLPAVADVNGDGWLDVAVPSMRGNEIRIYRSDRGKFDSRRFDLVPAWQADQLDFADMNGDGRLDLICASGMGPGTFFRDYGIQIFWGGKNGYDPKSSQRLPAHGAVGFLVQDWDKDGYLDLFAPNYHHGITREGTSARIYWGGPAGLDEKRFTYLPVNAAAGAFAMDFDGNGTLDIAISSHTSDGSHRTQSVVYYNRDGRFSMPREAVLLPTIGPQQMYATGAGNQYNRKLEEWYESSPIPLDGGTEIQIKATAVTPAGSGLTISYRAAAASDQLTAAVWQPVADDTWQRLPPGSRTLQYRVDFRAGWQSGEFPELRRIEVRAR